MTRQEAQTQFLEEAEPALKQGKKHLPGNWKTRWGNLQKR